MAAGRQVWRGARHRCSAHAHREKKRGSSVAGRRGLDLTLCSQPLTPAPRYRSSGPCFLPSRQGPTPQRTHHPARERTPWLGLPCLQRPRPLWLRPAHPLEPHPRTPDHTHHVPWVLPPHPSVSPPGGGERSSSGPKAPANAWTAVAGAGALRATRPRCCSRNRSVSAWCSGSVGGSSTGPTGPAASAGREPVRAGQPGQ